MRQGKKGSKSLQNTQKVRRAVNHRAKVRAMLSSNFSFLLLLLLSVSATDISSKSDAPPVYDLLPQYGLPKGLLPDSVTNYSLADDGSFVVELERPCYLHFDYLVYYDRKISGGLKYGSITGLKGIQVKKLIFWLDVDEIRVDLPPSDYIYFQVGWITRKLGVSQFQSVRSCSSHAQVLLEFTIIALMIKLILDSWSYCLLVDGS